jgi:anti-anti-sigma regulatory factor
MAQDFEISVHREGEGIHLKLKGDFDGISAPELLNALGTSCAPCSQVYIHTGSLKTLDQFGLQVFHSHFDGFRQYMFPETK